MTGKALTVRKNSKTKPTNNLTEQVDNSLSLLTGMLMPNGGSPLSQWDTMYYNNRWYMVSNNRQLVSQMYAEHGIVQTLVDQPVEDAFRTGFEVKTSQLNAEQLEQLNIFWEEYINEALIQGTKWTRLYGGGGVIVITDQKSDTPLKIDELNEETDFEFRAFDQWELANFNQQVSSSGFAIDQEWYQYYDIRVHSSRIFRMKGKEAPSFIRPRLRGWGMSELERLIRSFNSYLKNQDVIFQLLDEAKIDIFKIKGFNNALANKDGTKRISDRIQGANMLKNYHTALTMDMEDDYAQKQITFAGLGDILTQIRQGIAADLKMPMTKLFGISASGFSTGEEDNENYNSMVEREVRSKAKFHVVSLLNIACQLKFGFVPDDLMISFKSLRVVSAKDEEDIKDKKFNRVNAAFSTGLMTAQEAKQAYNKDSLLPIEVDETSEALPMPGQEEELVGESGKVDKKEKTNAIVRASVRVRERLGL